MSMEKETLQASHDALVRNLEMAAKERDAMAAKLKELEGQAERYKVLLSNSDHTQPMNSRMLAALRRIERWFGEFPPTGQQWDDGSPMSYFACYGSNGERDYMRSVARDAIAAAEAQQAEPVDERVIERTWARFCGAFGEGPDAPYPGMIAAFETHYGQSFRDKEWRTEAACWAAAWSNAAARAESSLSALQSDALEQVRAEEREACAKACEELFPPPGEKMAVEWAAGTFACANAIRARGHK